MKIQQAAKAFGVATYTTHQPCKHGHFSPRYTSNGGCLSCVNKSTAKHVELVSNGRPLLSRKEALVQGRTLYNTHKPCKYGHNEPRYVASGVCRACSSLQSKRYASKTKIEYAQGTIGGSYSVHMDDAQQVKDLIATLNISRYGQPKVPAKRTVNQSIEPYKGQPSIHPKVNDIEIITRTGKYTYAEAREYLHGNGMMYMNDIKHLYEHWDTLNEDLYTWIDDNMIYVKIESIFDALGVKMNLRSYEP